MTNRFAMIMAGGAGTRLWPLSRAGTPKQLLRFIERPGETRTRSLLEISHERLAGLLPSERVYICTSEKYRASIRAGLPTLPDANILGEPEGRDTVNAVAFAAAVFEKMAPGCSFCVLTADHVIEPVDRFQRLIDAGFRLVESDPSRLVTFSIKPTHPATGFGYLELGGGIDVPGVEARLAFKVERFVEKPTLERAHEYLASGRYGWNSGMFVWKATTFLDCLRRFKPESYEGVATIARDWGTPNQASTLARVYPTLPKTSVDYAVMEPASGEGRVATIRMDLSWLDVGSWPSFAETLMPDDAGNRRAGAGAALLEGSRGNLVYSSAGHTVALLGCEDLVIVQTPEATLVMPREKAESLKLIHARVPDTLK